MTTALTYNAAGNPTRTQVQGRSGLALTTIYTYTADQRLAAQQTPDGVVTTWSYTNGQVSSTTVGAGTSAAQTTSYTYDAVGRVTATTVGVGTTSPRTDRTLYNADGTIQATIANYQDGSFTSAQPDQDVVTSYGYDVLGRPIWTRDVFGRYTATHYDTAGRINWTVQNLTGFSGGSSPPAQPPAFSPSTSDVNIATFIGDDGFGRTIAVTETGFLRGAFDPATMQFASVGTRTTRMAYSSRCG